MRGKQLSLQNRKLIFTVTNDLSYDQRMHKICDTLSEAGNDVLLVGRKLKSSKKLTERSFKTLRIKCLFNKGFLFYAEYNLRLFLLLLTNSFDVVCGIDMDTLLPAWLVARIKGKKCFYDAHEYFSESVELSDRLFIKKVWLYLERFLIPKIDKGYTVSDAIANELDKLYERSFEVIKNVPYRYEEPSFLEKENYVLYQGALNEGRGLERLIVAMHKIDAVLLLAGKGDVEENLRLFVKQERLADKVKFLGPLSPEALRAYTLKAKVGVNLLEKKGLSYYYSLSNKFFDYIMALTPQLCIDFPEYRNINNEYKVALLIENLEVLKIVEGINALLRNNELYLNLQGACQKARNHYNWQEECNKLLTIYE